MQSQRHTCKDINRERESENQRERGREQEIHMQRERARERERERMCVFECGCGGVRVGVEAKRNPTSHADLWDGRSINVLLRARWEGTDTFVSRSAHLGPWSACPLTRQTAVRIS